MGYPKSFGEQIGKTLGSEKALMRMIGYLYSVRPKTAEEIADLVVPVEGLLDSMQAVKTPGTDLYQARKALVKAVRTK